MILRILIAVVLTVIVAACALLTGRAAADNESTFPSRVTPHEASRDLVRPWPTFPVVPVPATQGVIPAASQTAVPFRPAVPPSRPASATVPTSPSAPPSRSVATRSPDVRSGEAATSGLSVKARIEWCESRNDPKAVNKTSGASGLFQFLDSTWHSVTGLPGKASDYPADVQSAAFDKLFAAAGTRPWYASRSCWS